MDQNGTQTDQGFDDPDRLIGRDDTLASGVGGITSEDFAWVAGRTLTEIGYPSSFTVARTCAEIPMLTDLEDGSSAATASFQRWGHLRATVTTSPIRSPCPFTSRQRDAEVALHHDRARVYSVELRRLIQRDPLEYVDGLTQLRMCAECSSSMSIRWA